MGNPITGEAYLLLDQPENPPPPMELGFKPNRPYVPSVPSPFEMAQDRVPALLDRANATLETLREIVARMPDSLDRSDQFFDNANRIMRESELPTLSADSRKFFATTSAQIEQIRSDMDGTEGSLVKFSEDARAAIKAQLSGRDPSGARSGGQFQTGGGRSPTHPTGHSGFAPRIARALANARGAARVVGLWSTTAKGKTR